MIEYSLIPVMAVLNRVRGGGFGAEALPGHPRYWVSPVVAGLAWVTMPWQAALAFGLGYLFWSLWPWGYLMCLGHFQPQGRDISNLELDLLDTAGQNVYVALGLRHMLVLPGLFAAMIFGGGPWLVLASPIFAALVVGAYAAGWALRPSAPIELAELLVGALWGGLIILGGM